MKVLRKIGKFLINVFTNPKSRINALIVTGAAIVAIVSPFLFTGNQQTAENNSNSTVQQAAGNVGQQISAQNYMAGDVENQIDKQYNIYSDEAWAHFRSIALENSNHFADEARREMEVENYDKAEKCYLKAIGEIVDMYGESNKDVAILRYELGWLYYTIDQLDDSYTSLRSASISFEKICDDPQEAMVTDYFVLSQTYTFLTDIYQKQGDTEATETYLKKSMEVYDILLAFYDGDEEYGEMILKIHGGIDDLERYGEFGVDGPIPAIILDQERAGLVYFQRASAFEALGDYEKAIENYTKAIELEPEDATAYYNLGNIKIQLRLYEEAIKHYGKSIELGPDDSWDYGNRGYANLCLGRYEKAIEDFDTAIILNADSVNEYYWRGCAKRGLGRYEDAIKDFDTAIERNPEYANIYGDRGEAKFALGRYKDAIKDYDRAIGLEAAKKVTAKAYYCRGNANNSLRHYKDAIQDYDAAIELNPEYAEAFGNRGSSKFALGRYEEAIADYDLNIGFCLTNPVLYFCRGNANYVLERYEDAIKDYDKAIELDPEYAEAYRNRGSVKLTLGRQNEALVDAKMFQELQNKE